MYGCGCIKKYGSKMYTFCWFENDKYSAVVKVEI